MSDRFYNNVSAINSHREISDDHISSKLGCNIPGWKNTSVDNHNKLRRFSFMCSEVSSMLDDSGSESSNSETDSEVSNPLAGSGKGHGRGSDKSHNKSSKSKVKSRKSHLKSQKS